MGHIEGRSRSSPFFREVSSPEISVDLGLPLYLLQLTNTDNNTTAVEEFILDHTVPLQRNLVRTALEFVDTENQGKMRDLSPTARKWHLYRSAAVVAAQEHDAHATVAMLASQSCKNSLTRRDALHFLFGQEVEEYVYEITQQPNESEDAYFQRLSPKGKRLLAAGMVDDVLDPLLLPQIVPRSPEIPTKMPGLLDETERLAKEIFADEPMSAQRVTQAATLARVALRRLPTAGK